MSIKWLAYVVNSWLLESDTLDNNVVKNIFWPCIVQHLENYETII